MNDELLTFNGVNASTGGYLLPRMTASEVARLAQTGTLDPTQLSELRWRSEAAKERHLGVKAGIDPRRLDETGWGVIFAHGADPAIKEALAPLLEHRRKQAAQKHDHYYKEYTGPGAYRPNESKNAFLARHGAGPGPVDPDKVPYYLLIVGDPESIPYAFQYQLDVAYAVGRIDFQTVEEYARYARSVVAAETNTQSLPRRAVFFGVRNRGDVATQLSADHLVKPLAEHIAAEQPNWAVQPLLADETDKARLNRLLGGDDTPALLFTASHGIGFDNGDPRQLPHQGALLCQDWPGPLAWQEPIPERFYFAADDLGGDARPHGLIAFHFACFGAGTPRYDAFAHQVDDGVQRAEIAPHAFVAALPRALLSHPNGGALAVVGHVERAWSCSFIWERAGAQWTVFASALTQLMAGYPIGAAFESFNERYAELSVMLTAELEDIKYGKTPDDFALAGMWTANNDARGYAIIGDPAVRLMVNGAAATGPGLLTV